jgi:hypothetical protein
MELHAPNCRDQCYAQSMPEERNNPASRVDEYIAELKARIPPMEHGAVDSRLEELLNDSSADQDDVIAILHREFDPSAIT